jgi:hypothetical protein
LGVVRLRHGKYHRKHTASHLQCGVRVKRCGPGLREPAQRGKSAPRRQRCLWQGKPHTEQDQIGEEERPAPQCIPGSRRRALECRQLSGRLLDPGSNARARGMIAARLGRETEFGLQALLAHFQDLASILLRFCTPRHEAGSAEVRSFCVPLRLLVGGTRILDPRVTPEGYNHAHVAASALGAVRSLVLHHLPSFAAATASFGFRIPHLGAGDRGTAGRTQVSSHRLSVPPGPLACHFPSAV